MASSDLQISPQELKFPFELKKQIATTLTLHNAAANNVAFKVKTTSPKKYCVRPNTGIVSAGTTVEIQVIMQAQREWPTDLSNCKDKFLVQSVPVAVGAAEKDLSADTFAKDSPSGDLIKEFKLRVLYVAPPPPPSPIAEDESPSGSPPYGVKSAPDVVSLPAAATILPSDPTELAAKYKEVVQTLAALTEEKNVSKKEIAKLEKELSDTKANMDATVYSAANSAGAAARGVAGDMVATKPAGFSLILVLIIAIIAFFAGVVIF